MNDIAIVKINDRTEQLLKQLELLRERVEAGDITDFALALVYTDRRVGTSWSKTVDKWRLVGAVENLKHELIEGEVPG